VSRLSSNNALARIKELRMFQPLVGAGLIAVKTASLVIKFNETVHNFVIANTCDFFSDMVVLVLYVWSYIVSGASRLEALSILTFYFYAGASAICLGLLLIENFALLEAELRQFST
jgi:hypothetical protein